MPTSSEHKPDTWLFGYGSLIWRPAFDYEEKRPGLIRGWRRRFWQGSTDHRGVPGAPGRVVTLLPDANAVCWGMAFCIHSRNYENVFAELDHREKGGYERCEIEIEFARGGRQVGVTYIATEENKNYLGPASLDSIAATVYGSVGPSGANIDYVRRLAGALREIGGEDPDVFALEALLNNDNEPVD